MSEPRMLRPMEYGEIFNEAFDLYKRNFPLFFGICAMVYVPYSIVTALAGSSQIVGGLVLLLSLIPLVAANGAIVKALADRYLGREATIAGSWSYVLQRLGPFLLTSVMAVLLVVGGMLLFCIPGIIVAFWIFFVWSVMIVEDRFYSDAIRRGRELAAGQWGRILVIILLTAVLTWIVMLVVFGVIGVFVGVQSTMATRTDPARAAEVPMAVMLVSQLVNGLLQSVITPITTLLGVLLYFDVRVRKEGFDVELLAQEMGEGG